MNDEPRPTEAPYMVDEFGEITYLRPEGCPHCGQQEIAVYSRSCWRCKGTFEPIEAFGS